MIYFLQAPDGGLIKIGTTIRLTERLKVHQTETRQRLLVLGVMDGARKRERELHRQFASIRVYPGWQSEWFHPDTGLIEFIAHHARAWDGTDEAPPKPAKGIAVRVDITPDYQQRARFASIAYDRTMTAYIRRVIMEGIDRDYPGENRQS